MLYGVQHKRLSTKQVCSLQPTNRGVHIEEIEEQEEHQDADMTTLLKQHTAIFVKPTELPPKRSQEAKIILQPGAGPVSVCPYRYPFHQKTKIEKHVEEMLERGIIQTSNIPYSSPVL